MTADRHPYTRASRSVSETLGDLTPWQRQGLRERVQTVVATLGGDAHARDADIGAALENVIGSQPSHLWLAHAVLGARLPTDEDLADLLVRARLGGTWAALQPVIASLASASRLVPVEVRVGSVLCDVHTTAQSSFLSGIQRVVRNTVGCWAREHPVALVAWTADQSALRPLTPEEHDRVGATEGGTEERCVIVPWQSRLLWVEVVTNLDRSSRLLALAQHSGNKVGVLGYDSIPLTSASTVAEGMTPHFARSVAAVRRADRVAMISKAAAAEFMGVVGMGAGRADVGPLVGAVPLTIDSPSSTDADLSEARSGLILDGSPMVLVVGSHEPRKNHLAVLHAAERLWRRGLTFTLVLVGAGSWKAGDYDAALASLQAAGRPVQSIRGLPDHLLWAAYRLARVTVFPSLNEGFGLPVAESLAVGTPVITSDFGSMREIVVADGMPRGGLLVDPRDDDAITEALHRMLTDDELHARLVAETSYHEPRSWQSYAAELWAFLVDGVEPDQP